MNAEEARAMMHEWTQGPSLRVHMEAVGACMLAYGQVMDPPNSERWQVAGLLHDMDYERHPTPEEHPVVGVRHLESLGVDQEIREAILGHTDHTGVARTTPMAKTLYAVDELAGFIVACAKVRPNGIADLEAKSVKKKLKDRAFAAAVSREDIARGIAELGVEEGSHIERCIVAIRSAGVV
jgi:putative nucleotidyltransferase with HDIG domain